MWVAPASNGWRATTRDAIYARAIAIINVTFAAAMAGAKKKRARCAKDNSPPRVCLAMAKAFAPNARALAFSVDAETAGEEAKYIQSTGA